MAPFLRGRFLRKGTCEASEEIIADTSRSPTRPCLQQRSPNTESQRQPRDPSHTNHASSSMQEPETKTPDPDKMMDSDGTMGMIFLSQTVLGVLGNLSLLYYYLFLYFSQRSLRSTDWVLMHLIVANVLTLICKGVPQTMAGFGWKDFLNDCGCKGVFYLHKVGRSMSFSSISFLSVFQAITISPNDSKWAPLKCKAPKYVVACVNLSWILNLLINTVFLLNISSKQGNKSITMLKDFGYCSSVNIGEMDTVLHMVYLSFPDIICMWLMLWASGSMVLILHRHKRSMQHMFRSKVSPQFSPHTRATQTILLLMSTFICFYLLSYICQVCLALIYNPSWFLVNMSLFIAGCFPTEQN
ncbi:vomeronasal type-1 receptor 4-like [Arvicola amphibius]|uniref:vomeronasal type-1 receptor 4-like n=1 Tax=Arvicola amphibius TaxID=1047088 RepID=UPI001C080097|nr:vomeronasal type-1 receptor 4-like [Arvicola amphibius]